MLAVPNLTLVARTYPLVISVPKVLKLVLRTSAGPVVNAALVVANPASLALVKLAPTTVFKALYSAEVIGIND